MPNRDLYLAAYDVTDPDRDVRFELDPNHDLEGGRALAGRRADAGDDLPGVGRVRDTFGKRPRQLGVRAAADHDVPAGRGTRPPSGWAAE